MSNKKYQIHKVLAMLTTTFLLPHGWAADGICIAASEYQQLKKRYVALSTQFDMATAAQEFLEVNKETQNLKAQLLVCQKNAPESNQDECHPLEKQYNALLDHRASVTDRFNNALDMQEYLSTLKLRLETSPCE
jgi:hypothetical protein